MNFNVKDKEKSDILICELWHFLILTTMLLERCERSLILQNTVRSADSYR